MQNYNKITWIIAIVLFLTSILLIVLTQIYKTNRQKITPSSTPSVIPTITLITIPSPTLSFEDTARIQSEADARWARETNERYILYPWLDQLPLSTDNYFVYFDVEKKKFIGKIYVKNSDDTIIKNDVILSLKNIGIDAEKYGFIWK